MVQSDFTSLLAHSGWEQFLESGEGCTNDSLRSPDYVPRSSEISFGSWAEPDSYWCAEDGFNDGRVELFWQVELPQLAKEILGLLDKIQDLYSSHTEYNQQWNVSQVSLSTSSKYAVSWLLEMRPRTTVSSANLIIEAELWEDTQSCVVEQGTQDTALWGSYVQSDGVLGELAYFHHLRSAGEEVLNPVTEWRV